MKKNVFGRRFKRDIGQRKALFKSLMSSLVLNEKIKTTEAKAKAIKAEADKLITKARKEEKLARKLLSVHLNPPAIEKLITQIAPRFEKRQGGYTRIVKIGQRQSDSARIVLMEWTEGIQGPELKVRNLEKPESKKKLSKTSKTPAKSSQKTQSDRTVKKSVSEKAGKKKKE